MGKRVASTNVYLYDKIRERILWWVGRFDTISETFSACKEFANGIGQHDAFMIPSSEEEGTIWFDSQRETKFCFKIKVEPLHEEGTELAEEASSRKKT